jgi:flagellar motility protein MotE (MotC chaperone)
VQTSHFHDEQKTVNEPTAKLDHSIQSEHNSRMDLLEAKLQSLIAEQEEELTKLKEENMRVKALQEECQQQLERLNRETEEQQRQASSWASE